MRFFPQVNSLIFRVITMRYLLLLIHLFFILFSNAQEINELIRKAGEVYNETPAKSLEYCQEAENLAKKNNNSEYTGRIATCKARYYILVTDFERANIEINKALEFYQAKGDSAGLIHAMGRKALLLDKMGEKQAAHKYLLDLIEIQRRVKDYYGLVANLNNLSLDFRSETKLDSFKITLDELETLKPHFEPEDHYFFYQNLGAYYRYAGKYELAAVKLSQGLKVAEDLKMTDSKATCLMLMAQAYRMNKQFDVAEKYARESYVFSQENELIYEELEALQELVKAFEEQGRYQEAFSYFKKEVEVQNEIFDLQKIQKVKQMEARLELAEKEKTIANQEAEIKEEKLEKAEAQNRIVQMWGVILIVVLLLVFILFVYFRTRKLNATIKAQKKEVEIKSLNLEEALSNIEDSLEYSKLIQSAMLPPRENFKSTFEDSFILFKPKDIVSGAFYWMETAASVELRVPSENLAPRSSKQNTVLFAAADCTGHGVPGAMVSMVCHEALNKVVKEYNIQEPAKILDRVRDLVVETFEKNKNLNDGMDISLIQLHEDAGSFNSLSYAGAHNSIYIFRKGNPDEFQEKEGVIVLPFEGSDSYLIELKADKQPIGRFEKAVPFTQKSIDLKEGDAIYMFSDGYADQFGGDKGKKIKTSNFKKLLHSIHDKQMLDQGNELARFLDKWMSWEDKEGNTSSFEQIDDVCVIGIRI